MSRRLGLCHTPRASRTGPGLLRALTIVCALALAAPSVVAHAADEFSRGLDAYLAGDYTTAMRIWRPLADQGDVVAAFNIGVLYAQGMGVGRDPREASRWYRRAAEAGYAPAQFNLGSAYMEGVGVAADKQQAVEWWRKAAANNHPQALFNLATLYYRGDGVQRDETKAVALYRKAADLGDQRARQVLDRMEGKAIGATGSPGRAAPTASPAEQAGSPSTPTTEAVTPKPSGAKPNKNQMTKAAPEGAVPASAADSQELDWIRAQPADNFTIQVFAFADEQSAREFARQRGIADQVVIFRAESQDRTWYKAILGSYPDRDSARAAQRQLRDELKGQSPWLRRFGDVQRELKANKPQPPSTSDAGAPPRVGAGAATVGSLSKPVATEVAAAASGSVGRAEYAPTAATPRDVKPSGPPPPVTVATPPADAQAQAAPSQPDTGMQIDTTVALREPTPESARTEGTSDRHERLWQGQTAFNAQDYERAFRLWRPLAEDGMAEAQYGLGFMYESGWGVPRDLGEAFRWYRRAAEKGHAKAQFNLGLMYEYGRGVAKNEALGLYWIQSAADRKDARAEDYLRKQREEMRKR